MSRKQFSQGVDFMDALRKSRAFSLVVLVTLGLAGLFGLMVFVMILQPGFMGMKHFSEAHHRVHDLTFGFLLGTAVVGMLAQLRVPAKNFAGQMMALIPFIGLVLATALTNAAVVQIPWVAVGAFTLLATTLHPTGREFFRSFSLSRLSRVMLALVIIAAGPLLAFASANIGLQRTDPSEHAAAGHYGFLAAFSFTVIGAGLLASLRPAGWRLAAWVAGCLPALLGLTSVVFPDADSSLEPVWALAAIAWGVLFVAAAELSRQRRREEEPLLAAPPSPGTGDDARTPRWVYLPGVIVVVLVLLFAVMHLTGGGGPGLHTPPAGGS